jgi:hypothetical protein
VEGAPFKEAGMHLGVAFVPLPECSMIGHKAKFSAWYEDAVKV